MREGEASGSYIRIEVGRAIPTAGVVGSAAPLTFIDVDGARAGGWEGEVADQLRFVDETVLARHPVVVLRAPTPADPDGLAAMAGLIERRAGVTPALGEIDFPVGAMPSIRWMEGASRTDGPEVLAVARSIELASLLDRGKAHWKPETYHFQLPSGQHRADFIRVGDGLRSPRDARVVASWLHWAIAPGRAVLLDSSTLMPIVLALEEVAARQDIKMGPVAVRDGYPDSLLTDEELIELTVGASGALVLVSVSSTGRTLDALGEAVTRKGVRDWWVEALVDRTTDAADRIESRAPASGVRPPWLHVGEAALPAEGECQLCRSSDRAPAVLIDPGSFANTALPEPPVVVMPDPPKPARDIGWLLEMYRDVDGMGIDCDPAARTRLRRVDRRWGVRFYPHRLLEHASLIEAVSQQMEGDLGGSEDGRLDLPRIAGFDAIVALEEDLSDGGDGFRNLLQYLHSEFGSPGEMLVVPVPSSPEDGHLAALETALVDSSHILVATVGTVTGGTLHEILIRVNRALAERDKGSFQVSGFVLHARPPSFREWRSLRSAYSNRLVAAWMTYLPASDHPLAEELRLSRQTLDESTLSPEAAEFAQSRRRWVLNNPTSEWPARRETWIPDTDAPNPSSVLLCGIPNREDAELPVLQANSRFGHHMSMLGTLVGVGATLHRARLEHESKGGPPGVRFDLTRIPAVYFEVPILAAVLRWLRPFEAHWENESRSAEDSIREAWHQAAFEDPGNQALLLAEFYLAGASGKLPRHTYPLLRELDAELQQRDPETDYGPLEMARQLLIAAWGPWGSIDEESDG